MGIGRKITRRRLFNASTLTGAGVFAQGFLGSAKTTASLAGGRWIKIPETEIPVAAEADVVVYANRGTGGNRRGPGDQAGDRAQSDPMDPGVL